MSELPLITREALLMIVMGDGAPSTKAIALLALEALAIRQEAAMDVPADAELYRRLVEKIEGPEQLRPQHLDELDITAGEVGHALKLALEAISWRANVRAMLDAADPDIVRHHEGGGPEDLIASLAITMLKTRKHRDTLGQRLSARLRSR